MRASLSHKFVIGGARVAALGVIALAVLGIVWGSAPPWLTLSLTLLFGGGAGWAGSRRLVRDHGLLKTAAERMREGDLTPHLVSVGETVLPDETHELADGMRSMLDGLRELAHEVQMTSERVSAAADHLATSSRSASAGNEEICATVNEVAKVVIQQQRLIENVTRLAHDMASAIELNAGRAREAFGFAAEANQKANSGVDVSRLAIEKMRSVFERVEQLGAMVLQLEAKTRDVHQIMEIITSVASRTNLLSFNASIEAARAGEAGRGFAVVADEIRKLAENAARSAGEISKLIHEIEDDTQNVADEMRQSGQVISEAREDVNTIALSLEQIRGAVGEASARAEEIFQEADNQARDAEYMVESIREIARVAPTNAGSMDEVAGTSQGQLDSMGQMVTSAETLTARAIRLHELSQRFRTERAREEPSS